MHGGGGGGGDASGSGDGSDGAMAEDVKRRGPFVGVRVLLS